MSRSVSREKASGLRLGSIPSLHSHDLNGLNSEKNKSRSEPSCSFSPFHIVTVGRMFSHECRFLYIPRRGTSCGWGEQVFRKFSPFLSKTLFLRNFQTSTFREQGSSFQDIKLILLVVEVVSKAQPAKHTIVKPKENDNADDPCQDRHVERKCAPEQWNEICAPNNSRKLRRIRRLGLRLLMDDVNEIVAKRSCQTTTEANVGTTLQKSTTTIHIRHIRRVKKETTLVGVVPGDHYIMLEQSHFHQT